MSQKTCFIFQLLESERKVEGWLAKQQESDIVDPEGKYPAIQPVKAWTLDHIRADPKYVHRANNFTVSGSGAVGISCEESPSLSVMYPGTDKAPVILSNYKVHDLATFVDVGGKEYLAAACSDDGCLHLWDIESKTSRKVFDPYLSRGRLYNSMNIFGINENTIGYGEACASPDGSRRVFILKTDTEELSLFSTLRLFTPGDIWDICYRNLNNTPCLFLCVPHAHRAMSVDTIGGGIMWEARKEKMGERFDPWSICINEHEAIYVAHYLQDTIHVLSTVDGTVIKRFEHRSYGIHNIFAVRFHDHRLYVEHKNSKSKYAILKFKEFMES